MSSPVLTVSPASSIDQCMQLMTDQRMRHLPVVEAGKVIGMLSIGDLVRAVLEQQRRQIHDLELYIRG
jgi:CBS domain-containing protein